MLLVKRIKCCIHVGVAFGLLYLLLYFLFHARIKPVERQRFKAKPFALYSCPAVNNSHAQHLNALPQQHFAYSTPWKGETEARILLVSEVDSMRYNKVLRDFISYLHVPVRMETILGFGKLSLSLVRGRFSLIVFENYHRYALLNEDAKKELHEYCRQHKVGIISFVNHPEDGKTLAQNGLKMAQQVQATDLQFDPDSVVPYVGRKGVTLPIRSPNSFMNVFYLNSTRWKPILNCLDSNKQPAALVALDNGTADGVEHIVFAHKIDHFLVKIAFWDALLYMSRGVSNYTLDHYIEIDIDDIFVGQAGSRLLEDDIDALIQSQEFLRDHIENFNYTLGFSGHFFQRGDPVENRADEVLVANAAKFYWFPHMWHHNHATEYDYTMLQALMTQNALFAENFNLPLLKSYAVSPQHLGVYPLHEPLYQAWSEVWNVKVTSTEEYPHLKPAWNRRGFIHHNISVLPRQTCGLFTHTHFFHAYPDGIKNLQRSIHGGDLFSTILLNQFTIFMTHQQNYGNDRLALYTFHNEMAFLKCWTNLRLKWVEPTVMADLYFEKFPSQKQLLYTNPCADPRHRKMLTANVTCSDNHLPNVVIVGPQKTGTTALLEFLKIHPNITSNEPVPDSFEELQFFGGSHYHLGFDWYADKFKPKREHKVVIEKTANYFDNPATPLALSTMLPEAKIIVMIDNPVERAYSWYQHVRFHNDPVALKYSMEELVSFLPGSAEYNETTRLRLRCLKPGHYAEHLDRWLDYFPPSQIIIVDSSSFKHEPLESLDKVISRLDLKPHFDYSRHMTYVEKKGFYCGIQNGKPKCLGAGKGRKYDDMHVYARIRLNSYFAPHNRALYGLLTRYKLDIPFWLTQFLHING
uniref:[heparan sulfate]-glucosamine N-sulfotransferase n=1 Tax=Panagrellus redivivus TaxID=6233 RepID=A0A7E4ZZH6_PANRE